MKVEAEKFDILEITWVDSMILDHGEWMDADDTSDSLADEGLVHKTVGYYIAESEMGIAIAGSRNAQPGQNDRIAGGMVIPKGCVLAFTNLSAARA